ncbi:hypothetical protein LFREDSHE_17400 [Shewanella baltica]
MNKFAKMSTQFSLMLALVSLLSACGGDKGQDGNPGEPAKPPALIITSLKVMVDKVAITDGIAQVDFQVSNQDDEAVIGVPSATFIAAQLLPKAIQVREIAVNGNILPLKPARQLAQAVSQIIKTVTTVTPSAPRLMA